jgi:hypothetical protein
MVLVDNLKGFVYKQVDKTAFLPMLHNLIAEKLDNMDSNANLQHPQAPT